MLGRGNQVRGIGCYAQPVLRKFRCTSVSNGASFTTDTAESDVGFSLAAATSGRAVLTFPKCKRASFLTGNVINDTATEADRQTVGITAVPNAAAGTVTLEFTNQAATQAEENPETGDVIEIFMILDEGSS
jgi:hypothetical protein